MTTAQIRCIFCSFQTSTDQSFKVHVINYHNYSAGDIDTDIKSMRTVVEVLSETEADLDVICLDKDDLGDIQVNSSDEEIVLVIEENAEAVLDDSTIVTADDEASNMPFPIRPFPVKVGELKSSNAKVPLADPKAKKPEGIEADRNRIKKILSKRPTQCVLCMKVCQSPLALVTHIEDTHMDQSWCKICHARLWDSCGTKDVFAHVVSMHMGKNWVAQMNCPDLGTTGHNCSTYCWLRSVEFKILSAAWPFRKMPLDWFEDTVIGCTCGHFLKSNAELLIHLLKFHLKRSTPMGHVSCERCEASLLDRSEMLLHILTTHHGLATRSCKMCGKRSTRSGTINKHIKDVHRSKKDAVLKFYLLREFSQDNFLRNFEAL